MEQVIFIVWRESVEAMLVIGILYAWLRANPDAKNGMKYLWGGVGVGLGLATILGAAILIFQDFFAGDAQDYFQMGMVLVASALIVQMVVWMRKHGRTLKRELEEGMAENAKAANWWGMLTLVAIAVAREGSETVIFLYGMGLAQEGTNMVNFVLSALSGFVLALFSFWILQAGSKVFSWRAFFRFSETLLLLLAASLLVTGVEKMQSFEWLPTLVDPIWDSSALLADTEGFGNLLAGLTGYRAQPSLMLVIFYAVYWAAVWFFLKKASHQTATKKPMMPAQAASEGKA
ncbi:FTR1 family protein [Leeia sp. TBRC 13508]|uniref:FTR1 family protein n=1 Tax=Leeia speluncae TaxID=2884804 RepID=A0ABS8D4Q4_9NEIS|nr:FTR1 family protein [Leeia speluncae]MCB6183172.1 FTR1 family protein [Leeia speluncae]